VASSELSTGVTVVVHHSFISNGVGDGFLLPTSVGEILSTINAPPGGLPLVISQNISKPAVLPHLSGDVVVVQVSLSPVQTTTSWMGSTKYYPHFLVSL
jgi:hypothetical protein